MFPVFLSALKSSKLSSDYQSCEAPQTTSFISWLAFTRSFHFLSANVSWNCKNGWHENVNRRQRWRPNALDYQKLNWKSGRCRDNDTTSLILRIIFKSLGFQSDQNPTWTSEEVEISRTTERVVEDALTTRWCCGDFRSVCSFNTPLIPIFRLHIYQAWPQSCGSGGW